MLVRLDFPPGLYRVGTEYQSQGRFFDANLWRWHMGKAGPVGGWVQLGAGAAGTVRAAHTWVDLSAVGHLALASLTHIYDVSAAGAVTDITPVTPSPLGTMSAGSQWTMTNAGQQLFAVNDGAGVVWTWVPGDPEAEELANCPTAAAVHVTQERILMLLGANADPRNVQWSDVEDYEEWTPAVTNFSRDFPLQTGGELMCAKSVRGGELIWTTEDVHIARFIGRPSVYGFDLAGTDCGIISRGAAIVQDDIAYWMGRTGFFRWAGGLEPIGCPIHDDVFGSALEPARGINRAHASKVSAVHIAEFNEIWWLYPKGTATENSHVAVFNYLEGHWTLHTLVRTCGVGAGKGFAYPVMIGSDAKVWEHERGNARPGAGTIYARSGPLELGNGERVMFGRMMYPDEGAAGEVQTYVRTRLYPNASEIVHGPYISANPMGVRFSGRQAAIEHRLPSTTGSGRVGSFRVEVVPGGMR
jgi:hypothetical protein